MSDPAYGEIKCQATKANGSKCENGAYWKLNDGFFCGVHAKSAERIELKKDTIKLNEIRENRNKSILRLAKETAESNKSRGKVTMTKFEMMKTPAYQDGYLPIFPNRDHGNRSDGVGIPELSPMNLGPVNHGMKEYPPSRNLENFWQFAKVSNQVSRDEYTKLRIEGYLNPNGQRHGYAGKGAKIICSEFFGRQYSYVQARFFYCHYYEMLSKSEIEKLSKLLDDGFNLQIFGFDAFDVSKSMRDHYTDETKPFGHEAVIYCLLIGEKPWEVYRSKYPELYDNFA